MGTLAVQYLENLIEGKEVPQKCDVPYQIVRGGIIRTD